MLDNFVGIETEMSGTTGASRFQSELKYATRVHTSWGMTSMFVSAPSLHMRIRLVSMPVFCSLRRLTRSQNSPSSTNAAQREQLRAVCTAAESIRTGLHTETKKASQIFPSLLHSYLLGWLSPCRKQTSWKGLDHAFGCQSLSLSLQQCGQSRGYAEPYYDGWRAIGCTAGTVLDRIHTNWQKMKYGTSGTLRNTKGECFVMKLTWNFERYARGVCSSWKLCHSMHKYYKHVRKETSAIL